MSTTPITSMQFARLLDSRMREVAENKYAELPGMLDTFYRMLPSEGAFEEFYSIGGLPDIPTFSGMLSTLSVSPGYYTKIEPREYGAKVQLERKLLDDKKYAVLDNWAGSMGEAAKRTKEKLGARTFTNAFSSVFDFMTSEEGVSLCSSSHTTKAGVSTTVGFSNAGSSALSKTSVAATRLIMRKFRNDNGERIEVGDDLVLIVPDNLADTAFEITQTPKGLDTTEGNVNPQYRRHDVIPYMRLDDYDTNNWFMAWRNQMKKDLVWIDRVMPEFKTVVDFNTFITETSVYFRCAYGWLDWRWIYGHNVT